jgi:hypothetical protein
MTNREVAEELLRHPDNTCLIRAAVPGTRTYAVLTVSLVGTSVIDPKRTYVTAGGEADPEALPPPTHKT